LEKEEAESILRFAHACGALTVTKKGVIPALPSVAEVEQFLNTIK
jgi:sugar/nucleoside kinase (ribokinase family)